MTSPFKLLRIVDSSSIHLCAFLCAALIVFGFKVHTRDLTRVIGSVDLRFLKIYTPYFPGLETMGDSELFNPAYSKKKKIVILGASAAESTGCDGSWSKPDKNRNPPSNAHHTCSITSQLNDLLREQGLNEWQAFNLGRNGTTLTPMLYIYSRVLEVKPEVIVWAESFPFYMQLNAEAASITPAMYGHLDAVFDRPSTKALWIEFRKTLTDKAEKPEFAPPAYAPKLLPPVNPKIADQPTSLRDLLSYIFSQARGRVSWDIPFPVVLYPHYREFRTQPPDTSPFVNPDPGLAYFHGFGLIGSLQAENHDKMAMYFLPIFDTRHLVNTVGALTDSPFTHFLDQYGIAHKNLIDMPLVPVKETYDGMHQTRDGNRKIAAAILQDLIEKHYVMRKQ